MRRRAYYWTIGALSAAVLVITVDYQIYDNNFYTLSEATSLIAGDHPYRDFFEWGVPLQAALSVLTQWMAGHRLLGEFLQQWTLMVAGVVLAARIALRLSRSLPASSVMMLLAVLNLASSPTVHYSKLFVYPCALLIMVRYMERPDVRRSAAMGVVAAVAFFFRHDHGVYVGAAILLTLTLTRVAVPATRSVRSVARDVAACGVAAALLVVPWAIVVQRTEGLVDYVVARAYINNKWGVGGTPFAALFELDPVGALSPDAPNQPGIRAWLPGHLHSQAWLEWVSLLTVVVFITAALWQALARLRVRERPSLDTCVMLVAGFQLALVDHRLFREPGYYLVVAPLTAALGARLVAGARHAVTRTVAVALIGITAATLGGFLLDAPGLMRLVPDRFERLTASPPIEGLVTTEDAQGVDRARWMAMDKGDRSDLMVRYMHDCTAPGDRVMVMGLTPYQIPYYVNRPMAGGHLYWHDKWRSDPVREAQSLALLQRQAVPFVFSTHYPVFEDLAAYPSISAYLKANYVELDGSEGKLLIDARRAPTGTFRQAGFPCFATASGG